ncbi:MAG: hypothetical protein H7174_08440 [Flavobacterium sp.]|nr:hypothetical protein [Flavobacterium sp.]
MKNLIYLILIALTSCQFFEKKQSENELLKTRLQEINWQKVDKFPSIEDCEVLSSEDLQKKCFFDFIAQTIREKLQYSNLVDSLKNDTLNIKVSISSNGKIDFLTNKDAKLDSIIKSSLIGFPKISPAIKQGMFVKTEFYLKIFPN